VSPPGAAPSSASAGSRVLGFWSLLALGINGIVGVGIFFAPAELAQLVPGPWSSLAFALTALLLLPVAWTYGRLGSAFPEDGGPYVWAREALGVRSAFAVGLVAYASALLSTAAVVSGLGRYLAPALGWGGSHARFAFQLVVASGFCAVALLGLRLSAWVWSALTVAKLVPLLLLAGFGAVQLSAAPGAPPRPELTVDALARATLIAVFPLQGFEIVPVPAGEVLGGRRAVLRATVLSLLAAAALYVLLQVACALALPGLAHSAAPVVEAGTAYGGVMLTPLFAAGTNVSAIGIAFGMFAMTPRYLAALGTAPLLGPALARERRGVPVLALSLTTVGVMVLVSSAELGGLFVLSSLAVLLQYGVSAASLFRLAGRRVRGLSRVDRWLAPLSLLSIAALMRAAELRELAALGVILALGFVVPWARRALARSVPTR
jgi:basic amino acid/polyamine antiporter, APA family